MSSEDYSERETVEVLKRRIEDAESKMREMYSILSSTIPNILLFLYSPFYTERARDGESVFKYWAGMSPFNEEKLRAFSYVSLCPDCRGGYRRSKLFSIEQEGTHFKHCEVEIVNDFNPDEMCASCYGSGIHVKLVEEKPL